MSVKAYERMIPGGSLPQDPASPIASVQPPPIELLRTPNEADREVAILPDVQPEWPALMGSGISAGRSDERRYAPRRGAMLRKVRRFLHVLPERLRLRISMVNLNRRTEIWMVSPLPAILPPDLTTAMISRPPLVLSDPILVKPGLSHSVVFPASCHFAPFRQFVLRGADVPCRENLFPSSYTKPGLADRWRRWQRSTGFDSC
jgi:hypothetical protein